MKELREITHRIDSSELLEHLYQYAQHQSSCDLDVCCIVPNVADFELLPFVFDLLRFLQFILDEDDGRVIFRTIKETSQDHDGFFLLAMRKEPAWCFWQEHDRDKGNECEHDLKRNGKSPDGFAGPIVGRSIVEPLESSCEQCTPRTHSRRAIWAMTFRLTYAITMPKITIESWTATIVPRTALRAVSQTYTGIVDVFIPLPIPEMILPAINWPEP